jgi:hypothetical protein
MYSIKFVKGGGGGVQGSVGDHIVQEFDSLYLTRFRTYKIGGRRQINICRKVPIQVNILDNNIFLALMSI